jgi:hypothetical protein
MRTFLTFVATLAVFHSFSQTIQIRDLETDEGIPFVKIFPDQGKDVFADIDGYFTPPAGCTSVRLHMSMYRDTTVKLEGASIIYMRGLESMIEEVVVLPGKNPAERIMELAIENRKVNHPKSDLSFKYTSYSKFVFTMNPDAIASIPDTTADTNLLDMKRFFEKQHIMMLENTTDKYFEPPFREKEVITAYKVSGFTDPMFATFASELQTFNFYENNFDLLGNSYINPLAFGGIRRYWFYLEETTVNAPGDTTFTIQFHPRRDKNFSGMKGTLYVNSKGYALEKVIAEPATDSVGTVQAKIIQEYVFVDNKKWFPYKLSTEAKFPGIRFGAANDAYLIGKGSTYIDHIQLGIDLKDERFNAATVQTAKNAENQDSMHWDARRKYSLDNKELETYETIDSLSKANNLEPKLKALMYLAEGKVPLGPFQIDLMRLIDYREYEGYRLGLGLETSKKFMKRATIGGYFAYGTRDKEWKYGGYGSVLLVRSHFLTLSGRYQQDIIERGGTSYVSANRSLSLNQFTDHFYIANMERQRLGEVSLAGFVTPRIQLTAFGNYQRIQFTDSASWMGASRQVAVDQQFENAEVGAELSWTIREKVKYLGDRRVSLGSKWPKVSVRYAQSVPGLWNNLLSYQRFHVQVDQTVPVRAVGKLTYRLVAAQTWGDAPLYLTHVGQGTGGNWNLSVANTFETMLPSAFYNDGMAAVFTRFTFKAPKWKVKWTAPQIGLHHAMGTGYLNNAAEHSGNVRSMNKGYYEAGLILNNLLKINTLGLGIGAFYNYGYYAAPQAEKNLTFKVAFNLVLD